MNRSPSPHRYNTRNSAVTSEEELAAAPTGCKIGCCIMAHLTLLKSLLCTLLCLSKDMAQCAVYVVIAYVGLTMCGKSCDIAIPLVPSCSLLFKESAVLHTLAVLVCLAGAFAVPFGEVVKGIPTDRGTLEYLANAPFAVTLLAGVIFGQFYYDPNSVNADGTDLQCLASSILLIVVAAVVMAWKGRSLGIYCNTVALLAVFYLVDRRFNVTGAPLFYALSAVILVTAVCSSLTLAKAFVDESVSDCMVVQASRGLLVLSLSWYIAYTKQIYSFSTEGLQSFAVFSVLTAAVKLGMWGLRKECCKKSCIALITTCIALAGVLIQQKLIVVPKSFTPVWLVWNVWAVVMYAAVIVYARSVNILNSFAPLGFVRQVLDGDWDPRVRSFDLKFFCIRAGLLQAIVRCASIALTAHSNDKLQCNLTTLVAMTLLYALTKLVYMEKSLTSLPEIVEKKCSLSFMLWSLVVSPVLLTMPVRYAAATPIVSKCCWLQCGITLAFVVGLVVYALTTIQGHYLLLGEKHYTTKNLTTLQANGDEEIPIGGMWRVLKYPFLTGEIMVVACLSLSTGFEGILVYMPLLIVLVNSIVLVRSYNKIAPSFYGVRVWKDYEQMVPANIIPLFY